MSPRSVWPVLLILTIVSLALVTLVSTPAEAATPPHLAAPRQTPTATPTPIQVDWIIAPNKSFYPQGDVVTVTVQLNDVADFFGGELRTYFDALNLRVIDADPVRPGPQVKPGDLFPPGSFISAPSQGQVNSDTGCIIFSAVRLNQEGFTGDGSLVHIGFEVVGAGGVSSLTLGAKMMQFSTSESEPIPFTLNPPLLLQNPLTYRCPYRSYLPSLMRGAE